MKKGLFKHSGLVWLSPVNAGPISIHISQLSTSAYTAQLRFNKRIYASHFHWAECRKYACLMIYPFSPLEIQDPHWRPTSQKAHGVLGWCSSSRYHERQRQLLDDPTRVSRKGCSCARETWCDCAINPPACSITPLMLFFPLLPIFELI